MNVREDGGDTRRAVLIVLAFVAGGAVPIQLVTLSFGYAQYVRGVGMGPQVMNVAHEFARWYLPLVLLPALATLAGVAFYARDRYPDVARRIVVGLSVGVVATVALDAVRQAGVINGWLPADSPVMFGKMATGSSAFEVYYPVGVLIHLLNGANFGLFYAFVWGKRPSIPNAVWWATAWALVLELGMMTGPPMGPMVGLFGRNYAWPQLFLLTFVAHVVFGVVLGVLVQHFLSDDDRTGLLGFVRNAGQSGYSEVRRGLTTV